MNGITKRKIYYFLPILILVIAISIKLIESILAGDHLLSKDVTGIKLNYVIANPRGEISLALYEAERYQSAIIVQSLIGNLVYYSNQGRYEPRLAKKWTRTSPTTWAFELFSGMACENGDRIDASTFKESLQRTIKYLSTKNNVPILSNLNGYEEFIKGSKELRGIRADGNTITFEFQRPVNEGVLQILSFAPFGFIAKENLNNDGSWKDKSKFISSGPYKVSGVEMGKNFTLVKREGWPIRFSDGAPETIVFTFSLPKDLNPNESWIVDTFISDITELPGFVEFDLVPEYLNPIILGNLKEGYFSKKENRLKFRDLIEKEKDNTQANLKNGLKGKFFYPSQPPVRKQVKLLEKLPRSSHALLIEGEEPEKDSYRFYSWSILKNVLIKNNIKFKFVKNQVGVNHFSNTGYDIKMRSISVGSGAEAWGLNMLFCSDIGNPLPDPSGHICKLIQNFEKEKITQQQFSEYFSQIVDDEGAIIPMNHYGVRMSISKNIDKSVLSPTLSIIRFDQMRIN